MTYFVSFFVVLSAIAVLSYMVNITKSINASKKPATKDVFNLLFQSVIVAWGVALLLL
jgi:hypothetical protein|tara:strand:- start:536 stop:709 length:174 start_codon:yes stop_codon:yes gene_type:complete